MKTILILLAGFLLAGFLLASCDKTTVKEPSAPARPDPVEVLEEQVATERQLREKAETKAEEEAGTRSLWQLTALGLAVATVVVFFGGTAIGSRGKRHANPNS